ncbi:MAG: glycogen debranching protein GlgX [Elusimicrobia bacterium]|nr:glycogen debranching protein GlgX [Elusimicrobiota bacterium]
MRIKPGLPYPLGATWDGIGANFALFSDNATGVELCLFDSSAATKESGRIRVKECTDRVWHVYVEGIQPGQCYGYRVEGPYDPAAGHRFNPAKVLFDPYGKAVARPVRWGDEMFGYALGGPKADLAIDRRDNAASAPLASVIDPAFTWGDDRAPRVPWHKTLIYELHVKGFTQRHPEVPESHRGKYLGLTAEAPLRHLQDLGVTAVELMPVHHFVSDRHLVEKGLSNYWGYNTLGFFSPEGRYSVSGTPDGSVREFKEMVRAFHSAGIEVILDVVYNHTAEGNELGPTLSWRGIDNASYYRLVAEDKRRYMDFTGCGNTLNMLHARVLQLIMDSLRYWVIEMRVDGFRFDLASALARELFEVDRLGAFFDVIHQDPVLSRVKLIAEPWDIGEGGYQVGNFPVLWTEWNGKYRDTIRRFWKGDGGATSEMATRLAGSSDLYEQSGRRPYASINFATAHDGFTLQDLVSFERKRNEANLEENRDGENNNLSWNCGVEGPTEEAGVIELRERQKRNILATLLLSQGAPMIRGGDELSHSQSGNNNAYCQDSELSWLDWTLDERRGRFLTFARQVARLWRDNPVFQRRKFFQGRPIRGSGIKDISWLHPSGQEMTDELWNNSAARCLGMCLSGDTLDELDDRGNPIRGDSFLLLFNANADPVEFSVGALAAAQSWEVVLDTSETVPAGRRFGSGEKYPLFARSQAVLRLARAS